MWKQTFLATQAQFHVTTEYSSNKTALYNELHKQEHFQFNGTDIRRSLHQVYTQ